MPPSRPLLTLALDGSPPPAGPVAWCAATGALAAALAPGGAGAEVAVIDLERPQVGCA
jgi:hypothetical protein